MKILPVVVELFHADGQTDLTKLIVAFYNFSDAPRKDFVLTVAYCCHRPSYVSRRAVPICLYGFLTRFLISVFRFVLKAECI